jgi:hypothetical protein
MTDKKKSISSARLVHWLEESRSGALKVTFLDHFPESPPISVILSFPCSRSVF